MNGKKKACFTPHVMTHSLIGLGLGLLLTAIFPALSSVVLGLVVIVVGVALDMMKKG